MAETKENSLSKAFVGFVLERASAAPKIKDTGFGARMKRADNPDLEYQVWNILLKFNVDIEFAARRLPFCLIGAALCRRQAYVYAASSPVKRPKRYAVFCARCFPSSR